MSKKFVTKKIKHVHFMGIGGSALSGVALMTKNLGFRVSGCDLEEDTAYLRKVKKAGIKVFRGHSKKHLKGVDILSISPSVIFLNKKHPEYVEAIRLGILQTWDKFVGEYILKNKESICITGTHGKSTTTAMAALLLEAGGMDPSAIVGAKVKEWDSNYRIGKSKYFVIEADDFYEKFFSFKPSTIILNNIEFDHPDFFKSLDHMIETYMKFIKLLRNLKNLIINLDSLGNKMLLDKLEPGLLASINLWGYTLSDNPQIKLSNIFKGSIIEINEDRTIFRVSSQYLNIDEEYELNILGIHNVSNALGVVVLGKIYNIENSVIKKTLLNFKGTGRRMELIGEKKGIKVYDDYAHHPTAIKVTLSALRQKFPRERVWAVVEPHSYSRTKALLRQYRGIFKDADKVIVAPIFKARDTQNFGVNEKSIVDASDHKDIVHIGSFERIAESLKTNTKPKDVILVMGAGKSYQLARQIFARL